MGWKNVLTGLLIAAALAGGARGDTLSAGGLDRTYKVYRPAGLTRARPVPLVVVLHGGFGTGAQAERSYGWDAKADQKGFVVVYPDGIGRSWNAGGNCCGPAMRDNLDDVGFITRLIETAVRAENIDRNRVYLTGISNGAAISYRYACEGAFAVAAVGGVAGSLSQSCPHPRRLSVMEIHGLADTRIPFAGGHGNGVASDVEWLGVEPTLNAFRAVDRCGAPQTSQSGVVQTAVSLCAGSREVVRITISDAGHQWPGSPPHRGPLALLLRLDQPSEALDATDLLWNFFARHSAD